MANVQQNLYLPTDIINQSPLCFGEIQAHSSAEHDYLHDGFWALKREDELSNPEKL